MKIKGIIDEDFVNYKKPSMTIEFPYCDFKCGKEFCQNSPLVKAPTYDIPIDKIIKRYMNNNITSAIVAQGMEPLDSAEDLLEFIKEFRKVSDDDIVIFTGYNEDEIFMTVNMLQEFYKNIIIKFGRYIPNQAPHYDKVLGVNLASNNQYAERIC